MQGFKPQKQRKKESANTLPNKGSTQISPKKQPDAQAQALNQAPDTVPVMAKPGEFVLPPDTVDAVGGPQALQQVVDATHTPAPNTAVVPQGFEPEYFFSQGGDVPDEENKKRFAAVPASMGRRENTTFAPDNSVQQPTPAAAPVAAVTPSAPVAKASAPAAAPGQTSPSNIYPQSHPSAGAPVYQGAGFELGSSGKLTNVPDTMGQQGRQPAPQFPAPQFPANYAGAAAPQPTPVVAPPTPVVTRPMGLGTSAPQPDPMAGMAATGFNPNMVAKADRVNTGGAVTAPTMVTMGQPQAPSPTATFVDDALTDAGKRWDQGQLAGAMGAGARAVVGGVGLGAVEALDKTVGAAARGVASGASGFWNGLTGSEAQAATPPAPPAPPPQPGASPASADPVQKQDSAGAPAPSTTAASPAPAVAQPASTAAPVAQTSKVGAGIYQHGRGQYSDNASGMGFSPGFTGRPTQQNLDAASNLSAQGQRESVARVAAAAAPQPQVRGFRAPTVAHSGNDYTARKQLENLKTSASSIMNTERWGGKGASKNPAVLAYQQALQADLAAQGKQPDVDMQAMGFNAATQREQLNQDGALQRALIGERGANARDANRFALDSRRLDGEEQVRGFQVRQAGRLESAQAEYDKATTPEAQAAALTKIRALSGKGEGSLKDNYMALGGGQEWDTNANTMRNVPQRLVDLRTGQEVGGGARQQALPMPKSKGELKVGQVYQTARGPATWTGNEFRN